MRKIILLLTIMVLAAITTNAQEYTVLDSTITPDMKFQYVEALSKLDNLKKIVGREKIKTDSITHYDALQTFYADIDEACSKFFTSYIKVDTLLISEEQSQKNTIEMAEIREWMAKVVSDPDIEEATSFKEYREKVERLNELSKKESLVEKAKEKME